MIPRLTLEPTVSSKRMMKNVNNDMKAGLEIEKEEKRDDPLKRTHKGPYQRYHPKIWL